MIGEALIEYLRRPRSGFAWCRWNEPAFCSYAVPAEPCGPAPPETRRVEPGSFCSRHHPWHRSGATALRTPHIPSNPCASRSFRLQCILLPPRASNGIQWSDGLDGLLWSARHSTSRSLAWTLAARRRALFCRCQATSPWEQRQPLSWSHPPVHQAFRGLAFHPSHRLADDLQHLESLLVICATRSACQAIFFKRRPISAMPFFSMC